MDEKREKIIEKVKKLLKLSQKNSNSAEAEAAALKAQKLMYFSIYTSMEIGQPKN